MLKKIDIEVALDEAGLKISKGFEATAIKNNVRSRTGRLYNSFKKFFIDETGDTISLEFKLPYYAEYLHYGTRYIKARHILDPFYKNSKVIEDIIAAKSIQQIERSLEELDKNITIGIKI